TGRLGGVPAVRPGPAVTGGAPAWAPAIGQAVLDAALSGAWFSLKLAAVLLPALVLYELLAPSRVFAREGRAIPPWLSELGMAPPCTVPLAAGLFLGIIYGAGVILPIAEEKKIGPAEIH